MDSKYITLHELNAPSVFSGGYCPISVKEKINKPTISDFPTTNRQMFLSDRNVYLVTSYVMGLNKRNGIKISDEKVRKNVSSKMVDWAVEKKINDYESLEDIFTTLGYLNEQFLKSNPYLYNRADCSGVNVFNLNRNVSSECGKIYNKAAGDIMAHEYHTVDMWSKDDTFVSNKDSRYCNDIPIWQKSMSSRNLDRSNDGLTNAVPERASLNNQIHGYDMSNIIKGSNYYENPSYEYL